MSYIDLKQLKNNPDTIATFILNSTPEREEKTYSGGTFQIWNYNVLQKGQNVVLGASDTLKRKLDAFSIGDEVSLSYSSFTKDGTLRYFWKVEAALRSEQVAEQTTKSINEFDAMLKKEQAAKQPFVNNGARFGMIFNNTMNVYMKQGLSWTQQQFVENFNRIESFVDACENQETKPEKQNAAKDLKTVENGFVETVEIKEDDLPF